MGYSRGTPVSSTQYLVLTDPAIFTEPHTFKPERCFSTQADGTVARNIRLKKYLASLGGQRKFLGMNLAYTELSLTQR